MEDSTSNLVLQTIAGNSEAFSVLVREHQRMVFALAFQNTRNQAEAEDIAQETFCRAFRDIRKLRQPGSFPSWLYGMTLNVIREYARARKNTVPLESAQEPAAAPADPEAGRPDNAILEWLQNLPAKYRIPLTLYYVDRMKHREIAARLEMPESSVRSLVHRARQMLADILKKQPAG